MSSSSFDPIWEEKYKSGHTQDYPWDHVVSFIFRSFPDMTKRSGVRILEVGCGTGSNLWFAAREGFSVTGVDASVSAIDYVRNRFAKENLDGEFFVADFTEMDFENGSFDLVIDRAAITCCDYSTAKYVIKSIHNLIKKDGLFMFNPYSSEHSSFKSGVRKDNGLVVDISEGTLQGSGQICMYTEKDIDDLFANGWQILSKKHLEIVEKISVKNDVHSEWRVIAKRIS